MLTLKGTAAALEGFNARAGQTLAAMPLALILVQFAVVVMVYAFGVGSIQLQESLQYINALMFLGGAGYTALHDDHVRVDIFFSRMGDKGKAWVTLLGTLLLLFPFLGLFWASAVPYALDSWADLETSVEASGLPFVYLLKTTLLLFPLTLTLSGLADIARAVLTLQEQEA